MVQAAAQAQAVVAATKARGDLVPMNAAEIQALSQKQARAIVNARQQSSGTTLSETEVKSQIQLQAQALIHAHTQAQIALNIYKGDTSKTGVTPTTTGKTTGATTTAATKTPAASAAASTMVQPPPKKPRLTPLTLTPAQMQQQNQLTKTQNAQRAELQKQHRAQLATLRQQFQKNNTAALPSEEVQKRQAEQLQVMQEHQNKERNEQTQLFREQMQKLQDSFRLSNAAAGAVSGTVSASTAVAPVSSSVPPSTAGVVPEHVVASTATAATAGFSIPGTFPLPVVSSSTASGISGVPHHPGQPTPSMATVPPATSADQPDSIEFQNHLQAQLTTFWKGQLEEMQKLPIGTEHDFKNHNDLPLARIKRIMKSDEDVRMISAEAPVLFAKACEMFILELTLRSWNYSESNKRRTLQKDDIQTAIKKTDVFDFLVDVIN